MSLAARRRSSSFAIEAVERRLLMASIQVLNTNDSGVGSLRAAIVAAASGDTVDLTGLSGTITLATQLMIDKPLTIAGPTDATLTIDGGETTRAFYVTPAATASISDLTIAHGNSGASPDGGGAIFAGDRAGDRAGSLTLTRVALLDNDAQDYGGAVSAFAVDLTMDGCTVTGNDVENPSMAFADGGGVYASNAKLVVRNSTVTDNIAHVPASDGFPAGGGICLWSTNYGATFENDTFVGNAVRNDASGAALALGGGLYIGQYSLGVVIDHCTIVDNAAIAPLPNYRSGGGLMIDYAGTATVTNTLISGNTAANGPDAWFPEVADVTASHNLIADGTGSDLTNGTDGNQLGTTATPIDAKLGVLAENGGPVETIATLAGSPAIEGGVATSLLVDARGSTRGTIAPTIGAYEAANAIPTITSTPAVTAIVGQPYTYEIAAHDDDGDPLSFTYVTTDDSWNTLTDHGDGTATLAGVPPTANVVYPITVVVSDGTTTSTQTWTLNVTPAPTPPAVALDNGTLSVRGTDDADDIHVWTRLGGTQVRVWRDGFITNFDRSSVTGVRVDGGAGADAILVDVDTLGASVYGGQGNDTITGGAGDDTLGGGGGDDVIYGMAGRDVLRGHGGRDELFGGAGDDRLYGGDGRDTLDGGSGFDRCWGEAGRDTFNAADGAVDRLNGGVDGLIDGDRAWGDAGDLLTNVVAA